MKSILIKRYRISDVIEYVPTFGIILGLTALQPIIHNLAGSFLSSSYQSAFAQTPYSIYTTQEQHQSAFAQTPSSTNRVTAGFLPILLHIHVVFQPTGNRRLQ